MGTVKEKKDEGLTFLMAGQVTAAGHVRCICVGQHGAQTPACLLLSKTSMSEAAVSTRVCWTHLGEELGLLGLLHIRFHLGIIKKEIPHFHVRLHPGRWVCS